MRASRRTILAALASLPWMAWFWEIHRIWSSLRDREVQDAWLSAFGASSLRGAEAA